MKKQIVFGTVLCLSLSVALVSCATGARVVPGGEASPVWRKAAQPSESPDILRLQIRTVAGGENADFARRFDTAVKGRILCPEVKLATSGASDFLLTFRPQASLFDQTGENFLYTCELELTLQDIHGDRTFATAPISLKGKRTFGQAAALNALADQAAAAAAEWSNRELRQTAAETLAAANLAVVLPESTWEKLTGRDDQADSARMLSAASEVAALPGVLSCELLSFDREHGVVHFRVVYLRKEYPTGLLDLANATINQAF